MQTHLKPFLSLLARLSLLSLLSEMVVMVIEVCDGGGKHVT